MILISLWVIWFFSQEKFKIFLSLEELFPLKSMFRAKLVLLVLVGTLRSIHCEDWNLFQTQKSSSILHISSFSSFLSFWNSYLMLWELLTLSSRSLNLSFIGCFCFQFGPLALSLRELLGWLWSPLIAFSVVSILFSPSTNFEKNIALIFSKLQRHIVLRDTGSSIKFVTKRTAIFHFLCLPYFYQATSASLGTNSSGAIESTDSEVIY